MPKYLKNDLLPLIRTLHNSNKFKFPLRVWIRESPLYKASSTSINHNNKNRKRKTIWFHPPDNHSVSKNTVQTFLKLIDKHFHCSHRFFKIFNCSTIKVSCSCTDNIEQHVKNIISVYNRKRRVKFNSVVTVVTNWIVLSMVNAEQKTSYKCTSLTESN